MKKILIMIIMVLSIKSYSQTENFDCYSLNKTTLLNKYNQYKEKGFKLIHKGVDVIEFTIDDASGRLLKQMCINAWGEVNENGAVYTYGKFKRRNFEINYEQYLKDIQYLQILSDLRYEMIKNLN